MVYEDDAPPKVEEAKPETNGVDQKMVENDSPQDFVEPKNNATTTSNTPKIETNWIRIIKWNKD